MPLTLIGSAPQLNERRNMNFFLSKAISAFSCPKRYYWEYHFNLAPKVKSLPMWKGAIAHDTISRAIKLKKDRDSKEAIALAFAKARIGMEGMPLEHQTLTQGFILNLWEVLQDRNILETEKILTYPLHNIKNTEWPLEPIYWKAKLDLIEQDPTEGIWVGEIKTTSGYSPSTLLKVYHKSIQPWLYLFCASMLGFKARGVRMFIVTKPSKEHPFPVYVEDIPTTPQNFKSAETFIYEVVDYITLLETRKTFYRNRTACAGPFGDECPFILLCDPKVKEDSAYFNDLIKNLYLVRDPEEHLKEE